jgi:hypothetical protein
METGLLFFTCMGRENRVKHSRGLCSFVNAQHDHAVEIRSGGIGTLAEKTSFTASNKISICPSRVGYIELWFLFICVWKVFVWKRVFPRW